jgi:carbon-monoxide dehydrogenase medium subunit
VIPATLEYVRPGSLEEALAELAEPDAKAIAGGHSLVPMLKLRLARPSRLVDLGNLGFRGAAVAGGALRIGALTTYDDLLSLGPETPVPEALLDCAAAVGDVQIRNAGTLGGGLAHGDPASDLAAGVIATSATLVICSPSGTREVAAEEFFLGPFTTVLEQQELLTELVVPLPASAEGSAYVAFEDPASGYPLAGAAVRVRPGGFVVGLTGLAAHPLRARSVEEAIAAGGDLDAALDSVPVLADDGDVEYRRRLAAVAVERALAAARARAEMRA